MKNLNKFFIALAVLLPACAQAPDRSEMPALKDVYKEKTGMEFEVKAGVVKSPLSGSSDLAKQIAEMTKALNESSKSTKKNTKAVEDNTRKFNISDISRQAFDAAFNTKLKEAFITTI